MLFKLELLGECFLSVDDPPASSSLLDHRHPNALYFNENGRLIVGDSLGYVHVYDIKVKKKKKYIYFQKNLNKFIKKFDLNK